MQNIPPFKFLQPGPLRDGNLVVILHEKRPPQPEKGYTEAYYFHMLVDTNKGMTEAGKFDFRARSTPGLELLGGHYGYGVHAAFRGQHFAERTARLLGPFVRAHGFDEVVITCDPGNWPSRRTCERLGAKLTGIVPVPPDHEMSARGLREKCRYVLDLREIEPRAYD